MTNPDNAINATHIEPICRDGVPLWRAYSPVSISRVLPVHRKLAPSWCHYPHESRQLVFPCSCRNLWRWIHSSFCKVLMTRLDDLISKSDIKFQFSARRTCLASLQEGHLWQWISQHWSFGSTCRHSKHCWHRLCEFADGGRGGADFPPFRVIRSENIL